MPPSSVPPLCRATDATTMFRCDGAKRVTKRGVRRTSNKANFLFSCLRTYVLRRMCTLVALPRVKRDTNRGICFEFRIPVEFITRQMDYLVVYS